MFPLLPQRGLAFLSAIAVQDASIGTVASAQSQTVMQRTVGFTEAACREESGCEDSDALDGGCPSGLSGLA
jgi:hypothetical protein